MPSAEVSRDASSAEAAIARTLELSVLDALFYAVVVGVCESYMGAFAVALGHDSSALALLVTVPLLVGASVQLFVPRLVQRFGGRKRFVVCAASAQALCLPLLFAIALRGERSFVALLIAKTLYWSTGGMAGVAWSAWMETLTRTVSRERFFAMRSAAYQAVLLVAFIGAGMFMRERALGEGALVGFAILFAIGTVARLLSAAALGAKIDPGPVPVAEPQWPRLTAAARAGSYRIPIFIGAFMLGAQISIPFFTPYMLRELHLDLFQFSVLTSASLVAKMIAFPACTRIVARLGMRGLFVASAVAIAFVPLLWAYATSFEALLGVQALSGAAWAGFEYASLQLLMRASPPGFAVEFFSLSSAMSGALQLAGSLIGSTLLVLTADSYRMAFLLSSGARGVALLLLIPVFREIAFRGPLPALLSRTLTRAL